MSITVGSERAVTRGLTLRVLLAQEFVIARRQSIWLLPSGAAVAILYQVSMGFGLSGRINMESWGSEGQSYAEFLFPGLFVMTLFAGAFSDNMDRTFTRARLSGYYSDLMRRPVTSWDILIAGGVCGAARATLYAIGFVAASVFCGVSVSLIKVAVAGVLVALLFGGCGFAVPLLVRKKLGLDIIRFCLLPLNFFSGIFFPISSYPRWGQFIAQASPIWQGRLLVVSMVAGRWNDVLVPLCYLLSISVGLMYIGHRTLRELAD